MTSSPSQPSHSVGHRRRLLLVAVINFVLVVAGIALAAALRATSLLLSVFVLVAVLVYSLCSSRRLRRIASPDEQPEA